MQTVVFDLDGTLALIDHRKHLVQRDIAAEKWLDSLSDQEAIKIMRKAAYNPAYVNEQFEKTGWKPRWDDFYRGCVHDKPNMPVIEALRAHRARGNDIVIFSGRSEIVKEETKQWLIKHSIQYDSLIMRPDKDYTPDEVLKSKWADMYLLPLSRILCVYDDRDKVVAMWRAKGIPCFQVASGDF